MKQFINKHCYFIIINLVIAFILIAFPQIDLGISELFYNPEDQDFTLNHNIILRFIHQGVRVLVALFVLSSALYALYCFITKKISITLKLLYLILTLAIGPGLIVNQGFKEYWGRARPNQIKEFGGAKEFSQAWIVSNQCAHNCSFVSGHAAIGFWLSSWAFIISNSRKRKILFYNGILAGLFLGLVRIMMGGHFLSDVYFSGVIVILTSFFIHLITSRFRSSN